MIYFADTSYFLARLNSTDRAHLLALSLPAHPTDRLVTTEFVMLELADGLSDARNRHFFLGIYGQLRTTSNVELVEIDHALFAAALDLYRQRPDKDWSLTDCTSFIAMQRAGITHALTADRHFEQAGFVALLK